MFLVYLCGMLSFVQGAALWLDVPFFKQEKDGCGAAVIAMVVEYWNQKQPGKAMSIDMAEIQKSLYSNQAHGIYASELKRYFEEHGFRAFVLNATWDDFQHHLEKGRPLIVALKPMTGQKSLHYVLVVGLDSQENVILVNDPAQKKLLKLERPEFEKQWNAVQRWTLLALPR
jgi:ABC-type bacteriocin/lantibiotic exporter with double-glycine peptidase domain